MAWDLARAWEGLYKDTLRAYPAAAPGGLLTSRDPAYWLVQVDRSVMNIGRLGGKVQKALSRGIQVLQRRDVDAHMHSSRAPGYSERLGLYLSSQQRECGSWLKAMPWMDEGDMSITNSDLLVATAMRYGLDLQPSAVPRQFCPCGHQGPFAPPSAVTEEEKSARAAVQRVWARHAMSCQKGAGRWSIAHDIICDIIVVLLKNAGFSGVELEPQFWDAGAAYDDKDHRRPDIVCHHPVTGEKWVIDVVIWWGESEGVAADGGAVKAGGREKWKVRRYRRGMWARLREQMTMEQAAEFAGKEWEAGGEEVSEEEWALVDQPMRFVPVGCEAASGVFGRSALDFFRQVEVVAGRSASTDLYHWSAFVFGEHWRQRLSLALTRGQASLVLGAVAAGRNYGKGATGRKASAEWSSTDCQPCVDLS